MNPVYPGSKYPPKKRKYPKDKSKTKSRFRGKQRYSDNNADGVKTLFRSSHSYGINPDPFPTRLLIRCKYADDGVLTSNSSLPNTCGNEIVYRLNSIYDPYYSIGGTTTVGWSTISAIYNKYIVTGAKVEVTFYDPSVDAGVPAVSLNQVSPIQNLDVKQLGENALTYTSVVNNSGSQKKTFSFYVKPWQIQGLSKLEWMANKSTKSCNMNQNPTDELYIRLAYCAYQTNGSIKYAIRIIYYTECFERTQLTSSSIA